MEEELYLIFTKENDSITVYNGNSYNSITPIGSVFYDEFSKKLFIDIDNTIYFDNIIDLFKYVKENNWILYDIQGNLYNLNIHMSILENIKKIGIGCISR